MFIISQLTDVFELLPRRIHRINITQISRLSEKRLPEIYLLQVVTVLLSIVNNTNDIRPMR